MLKDNLGVEFTTSSPQAIAAFDQTMDAYFRMGVDIGPSLKAVLDADPEMPMAHCLKGYFFHLMALGPMQARAQKAHQTAVAHSHQASRREQAHIAALGKWCADDKAAATDIWNAILDDHPRDVIALRLAHHAHFYEGNADAMRKSLEAAFPSWDPSLPGYSYVLGMRSFAFEECGDYEQAEQLGRKAVELNPVDPWAIHAVSHVMEMQDRHSDGIEWITDTQEHWQSANNFRYHLVWHRAVMHLGRGEFDRVLEIYDNELWDPESNEYLDICNDVSLLLRLEFYGLDVGPRWQALHEKVQGRSDEHILTFADAHFGAVFSSVGDRKEVDSLIQSFDEKGGDVRVQIGAPLCRAVDAYKTGEYGQAKEVLLALRGRIIEIGGSHAQRDVFELLLIEASIKSGDLELARHMLENRTQSSPNNGLNWRKLSTVLSNLGDAGAEVAGDKASRLLIA